VKRSDLHKGWERIGREIASSRNCAWSEYWIFLRAFGDLRTDEGLKTLEQYFREKTFKEQESFEKILESKMDQLDDKWQSDDCKRKLDFGNFGDDLRDEDSSRDSSDLYFDASEAGDSSKSPNSSGDLLDQDDAETRDGYFTPPQELTANVILGKEPTKLDRDVYTTLESVVIDEARFPQTAAWMKMIRDFSEEERRHWAPLDSPRSASALRHKLVQLRTSE